MAEETRGEYKLRYTYRKKHTRFVPMLLIKSWTPLVLDYWLGRRVLAFVGESIAYIRHRHCPIAQRLGLGG